LTNMCFCGNPIGHSGILCTRCEALRVLELDSHATQKEIKTAYRLLIKVWHPDRFQGDATLKYSAEQKLKNVNIAYRILTETSEPKRDWEPAPADTASQTEPGTTKTAADWTPEIDRVTMLSMRLRWTFGLLFKIAVLAFAILIGRYIWIAFDLPGLSGGDMHRVYDAGLDNVQKELPGPQHRFLVAIEHDLRRLGLNGMAASVATELQAEESEATADEPTKPEPASSDKPARKPSGKQSANPPPAPRVIRSYITIGSTRDEVIAKQGPPTTSSEDKLVYGHSELDLKDGAVVGWRIDPASDPIRVKLWPEHSVDTSQTYFTVDSTKDDVLVVQGTPTAFSKDKFEYGGSVVYFHNDRVVSWKNDPTTIPLRIPIP